MNQPLLQTETVSRFACTGSACEDTCCKGWGMQIFDGTLALYKEAAPELLDAITSGEAEHILKRDEQTDYCIKFDDGWCGIHKEYGDKFLGDACHFFPRITRRLGSHTLMSATLSCPEVTQIAVLDGAGQALAQTQIERLPETVTDYCPQGLEPDKALALHQFFVEAAGDEAVTAARIMVRLREAAQSLEAADVASWGVAGPFYYNHADSKLAPPQPHIADPFNLLNALQGLVGASKKAPRKPLMQTIATMEAALDVALNWDTLGIETHEGSLAAWQQMEQGWQQHYAASFEPVLKRWLQAELSAMCFPFAGLGHTLSDRASLLGVRFATLRLALMSACHVAGVRVEGGDVRRIIQSLARFLGHLADPALSLQIYTETGWLQVGRLRSLVGDS